MGAGLKHLFLPLFLLLILPAAYAAESEVVPQVREKILVREHIRTGKPYVVITNDAARNPLASLPVATRMRPDYRMLDPKVKKNSIPYQGPVSDRKKVYIFAGTIAALGTAGGAAIIATAPAATGVGAAGGAGGYAAAGTAVGVGSVSTALLQTRPDPDKDKIEQGFASYQDSGKNSR